MRGVKHGTILATTARIVFAYENSGIPVPDTLTLKPTKREIFDLLSATLKLERRRRRGAHGRLSRKLRQQG